MTKVFLDNEWVDFDYSTLYHTRGITDTPSTMLSILDDGMSQIEGWFNSGYVWITQDILWYPEEEVPYYVRQESPDHLYYIDSLLSIPVFKKEGELFDLYQDSFYMKESLFTQFGLTETPSQVWDIDAGVPWSWYNPDLGMYWDDRNGKKYWSTEPPVPAPPTPPTPPIPPFTSQGVTGTFQLWGDSPTTGIEFGTFAYGKDSLGIEATSQQSAALPMSQFNSFIMPSTLVQ